MLKCCALNTKLIFLLILQVPYTKKRRNRMRNDSAAAIALNRSGFSIGGGGLDWDLKGGGVVAGSGELPIGTDEIDSASVVSSSVFPVAPLPTATSISAASAASASIPLSANIESVVGANATTTTTTPPIVVASSATGGAGGGGGGEKSPPSPDSPDFHHLVTPEAIVVYNERTAL